MLGNGTQSQTLLLKESSVRHVYPNRTPIVLRVPALSSAALFCLSTVFSIALVARIERYSTYNLVCTNLKADSSA